MACRTGTVLTIKQGSKYAVFWPVAPDPTGGTILAQVRVRHTSEEVLHEWSTALGNATVDADGVTLMVPAAVSETWDWRTGVFDVELTLGGETYRLDEGTVVVEPEVTRA